MNKLDRSQRETVREEYREHPLWRLCRDVATAWGATSAATLAAEDLFQNTAWLLEHIFENGSEAIDELPLLWRDITDETGEQGATMTFTAAALALAAMPYRDGFYRIDAQMAMRKIIARQLAPQEGSNISLSPTPQPTSDVCTCVSQKATAYEEDLRQWLDRFCESDESLTANIHRTLYPEKELVLPTPQTIPLTTKAQKCQDTLHMYRFEELPMVKGLDDRACANLYERITQDAAFGMAMFHQLGFFGHCLKQYGLPIKQLTRICAEALGSNKSTCEKYYYSLNSDSQAYDKHNAKVHLPQAKEYCEKLLKGEF